MSAEGGEKLKADMERIGRRVELDPWSRRRGRSIDGAELLALLLAAPALPVAARGAATCDRSLQHYNDDL